MTRSRLVSQPDPSTLEPVFPTARLLKGAVLEAEHIKQETVELKEQAQAKAKQLWADAVDRGKQEGAERFVGLIDAAAQHSQQQADRFPEEVTAVALKIARAVLDVEFAAKPERITDLIKTALNQVRDRFPKRIVAHLHPDDYALVAGSEAEFGGLVADDAAFGFVQDTEVPRHGVQLETELGHYDFAVGEQLDRLKEQLLG